MYKKIFQILIILLFFVSFGYFFGDTYWDFHTNKIQEKAFYEESSISNKDFSFASLTELGSETQLFQTPDKELLEILISQIDNAKEKVYVEVYIFTEKKLRDALIQAHRRGIDIKILLENNPYQAPYINDAHFEAFEAAGIDVRWSDPLNYSLNHSKLLLIDDYGYVSTGNFSYSLFTKNKDFLIYLINPKIIHELNSLFMQDYQGQVGGVFYPNIVLSPINSRQKIEYLITSSTRSIDFYFPYITDAGLEKLLFDKAKKGVKVRGIVDKDFYKDSPEIIARFHEAGIEMRSLMGSKLHAKSILGDGSYLYIGSINFSSYSFDKNREIGLIITDLYLLDNFKNIFEADFQRK